MYLNLKLKLKGGQITGTLFYIVLKNSLCIMNPLDDLIVWFTIVSLINLLRKTPCIRPSLILTLISTVGIFGGGILRLLSGFLYWTTWKQNKTFYSIIPVIGIFILIKYKCMIKLLLLVSDGSYPKDCVLFKSIEPQNWAKNKKILHSVVIA